jgi:Xaa-Pro aminopeptidase
MKQFSHTFFINNRKKLADVLPGHLVFVPAHALVQSSADLHYPFRQDSNFWYLCGINEPDAVLVIDTTTGVSTLLLYEKNSYQDEWDGASDQAVLKNSSGIDEIGLTSDLAAIIHGAVKNGKKIGYLSASKNRIEPYGFYANPARSILARKLKKYSNGGKLHDIRLEIARLRQVKQPLEIEAIKSAIKVTAQTLIDVKKQLSNYATEKDIERAITTGFYSHGGDGHAYDPIVASGKNAAVIHYTSNNDTLKKQTMLLLDVGAKIEGYAADISRTWSLGSLTTRQEEVYQACLDIQQTGIAMLRPGVFLKDVQSQLSEYAQNIFKKIDCSMQNKPFPHGFSHFLGLDVHDAGDYSLPLVPGVVLTMEPGIYLADEGIGVRIEDDILITEYGSENLSEMIPRLL